MVKEQVWSILGIAQTKDENVIKNAYREKLVSVNPEDDAEGFKRLREAYEMAIMLCNETENEQQVEKNEVDLWVDRVAEVYASVSRRINPEEYKNLFQDEVCMGLDTADEAREKFLVFLMDHFYFPNDIYKLFDAEFDIIESVEELKEKFPMDFLNYVCNQIRYPGFIDYKLFECLGLSEEDSNVDQYINSIYEVKRAFDDSRFEEAHRVIEESKAFMTYHPCMDVEIMRVANYEKDTDKALKICKKLLDKYGEDMYIRYICTAVLYDNECYEEAMANVEWLLEKSPEHYGAKLYLVKEQKRTGDFTAAKEGVLELLEKNPQEPNLVELMREINVDLKNQLFNKYKESDKVSDGIEYAWCLFQNEDYDGTIKFLDKLTPTDAEIYDYTNLYGRCLFAAEREAEALPYVERWRDMIEAAVDDGSEKYQKKIRRKGFAYGIVAMCCTKEKLFDKAIENYKKSIECEENPVNRLSMMERFANCYIEMGENEKAIDVCNSIIEEDERYYPAYINRQQAYFNMKYAREVLDDYYNAVSIYGGYYKPYYLAAQVYYIYKREEDCRKVLADAKEAGIDSVELDFIGLKLDRIKATNENRQNVIDELIKLLQRIGKEKITLDNPGEIHYELSLAYYDDEKFDKALKYVNDAMKRNPEDYGYLWTRGDIHMAMRNPREAVKDYSETKKHYNSNAGICIDLGNAYSRLGDEENALANYLEAIEIDPENDVVAHKISQIYWSKYLDSTIAEDDEKAIHYAKLQIKNYDHAFYRYFLGRRYFDGAYYEEAIAEFNKCIQMYNEMELNNKDNSEYLDAHIFIGRSYTTLGDYDKALAYLNHALKIDNSIYDIYRRMAECYESMGKFGDAVKMYRHMLNRGFELTPLYDDIESCYINMDNERELVKLMDERVKAGDITRQYADLRLAYAYTRMDKSLKLKMLLKKIDVNALADDAEREMYADIFYYYYRDYATAIKFYEGIWVNESKDRNPDRVLQFRLAMCYYQLGDKEKGKQIAQEIYDSYVKKYGSIENYTSYRIAACERYKNVANVLLLLGQHEEARVLFQRMSSVVKCRHCTHSSCYESYLGLGRCCEMMEAFGDAYNYYLEAKKVTFFDCEIHPGLACTKKYRKK